MVGSSGTASILVVCVGNVRRSVAVERLLRHGTAEATGLSGSDVSVGSAGVAARPGAPIDPFVAEQLLRLGAEVDNHAARELDAGLIQGADLVLTAERAQRSSVVRLVPAAVQKTFTVREFAALSALVGRAALVSATDPASRLRMLVELAPLERSRRAVPRSDADDLLDPRHGSRRAARRLLKEIDGTVATILNLLEPEPTLSLVSASDESDESDASAPIVAAAPRVVG